MGISIHATHFDVVTTACGAAAAEKGRYGPIGSTTLRSRSSRRRIVGTVTGKETDIENASRGANGIRGARQMISFQQECLYVNEKAKNVRQKGSIATNFRVNHFPIQSIHGLTQVGHLIRRHWERPCQLIVTQREVSETRQVTQRLR